MKTPQENRNPLEHKGLEKGDTEKRMLWTIRRDESAQIKYIRERNLGFTYNRRGVNDKQSRQF